MKTDNDQKSSPDFSSAWSGHFRNGAFWLISLRWAIRLTGVVSTVILARLLAPRDFGIVAMAMVVVGALETFGQTGQLLALIRLKDPTPAHYNSAWTISVLIGTVVALTILLIAPFTVLYFKEPAAVPVMQCLALRAFLGGFENVGVVDFRRDLAFNRYFLYNVLPKFASFTVTIIAAFTWRNYWALVAGIITGQFATLVLSMLMHSHRPRFSFAKVSEIWSFSIWALIRHLGEYFHSQIDKFIVAGISGSAAMGRYAVAADISSSPSVEVNEPMVAALYPVMSRLQNDPETLLEVFLRTLSWSTVICVSASVGVILVAEDMSELLLGAKWVGLGPLVGWLAAGAGIMGLSSGAYSLFDALGLPHVGARMIWLRTFLLVAMVAPIAFLTHSLIDVAIVRSFAALLFLPGLYVVVSRLTGASFGDYVRCMWRPVAAAAVMAAAVEALNMLTPISGPLRLFADVFLGAGVFFAASVALWTLSGKPPGPEADAVSTLRSVTGWRPRAA